MGYFSLNFFFLFCLSCFFFLCIIRWQSLNVCNGIKFLDSLLQNIAVYTSALDN